MSCLYDNLEVTSWLVFGMRKKRANQQIDKNVVAVVRTNCNC